STARWFTVDPAGASIVTWVMLLTIVVLRLLTVVLFSTRSFVPRPCRSDRSVTRMPGATMGGAPVITAGAVPGGAGTIRPRREPGGGGKKTPCGPTGAKPCM